MKQPLVKPQLSDDKQAWRKEVKPETEGRRAKRPVQSIFYREDVVVRINHAAKPNNAVIAAIKHMQVNQYDAGLVEVFNSDTGKLYAVVRWADVGKTLQIVYRAKIEDYHGQ